MKHWIRLLVLLPAWTIMSLPGLADAEQQPPLRVGSRIGFPPYADVDNHGQPTGFTVELFTAVAAVMDIPVTFQPDRAPMVWQKLKAGKIDALPLVARVPEREDQVEFTEPHTIGYDSFFVRKGDRPIKFIEQARTLSIIVLRSDTSHDELIS
ncbi:MAG TPA: transporter substrate-binding domain-containing protein, partial [Oculatellaceae cyanobacterium]